MTDEQPREPETTSGDGQPDALAAADDAITEAKQAEQHLRDTAPDALDVRDDEG